MAEVEVLVDKDVFDEFEYPPFFFWLLMIFCCVCIGYFVCSDFLSFLQSVLLWVSASFLTCLLILLSLLTKARSRDRRYSGLAMFASASLLILATMDLLALSLWFSLPRGHGIVYAPSYTRNFLIFLLFPPIVVFVLLGFLKTVVEFDVMLREPPRKLPEIFIVAPQRRDDECYVVSVPKILLYIALILTIGPFCYYLWEVIASAYVNIFTILGVFLILFAPIALSLLENPLVKSVVGTRIVVRRREEEVDYETWV